jgi:hypothetical protein
MPARRDNSVNIGDERMSVLVTLAQLNQTHGAMPK